MRQPFPFFHMEIQNNDILGIFDSKWRWEKTRQRKITAKIWKNPYPLAGPGLPVYRISGTLFHFGLFVFSARAFFLYFFVPRRSRLFVLGLASIFGAGLCFVFADAMFLYWKFSICLNLVCIIILGYNFE